MSDLAQPKNIIDRVIEAVAPGYARERYIARSQIDAARNAPQSSYRGAIGTRANVPWSQSTSYRGGSTVDRRDLGSMRDRARRAYRENTIARSLLDTETDYVVGNGFSLHMQTEDKVFNKEAEDWFWRWMDRADVTGKMSGSDLFRASWRESRKDGDGGIALIKRGGRPYLQYIPGDLVTNRYGVKYDPRTNFDGVECDPSGKPIQFNVRDVDENGRDTTSTIPARDFVWLAHLDDMLAVRGRTVFGSIFQHLEQIDTYVDSVTKAAIMACIFGLIHKVNKPGAQTAQLGTATNSQGDQQSVVTLENGMLRVEGTAESTYQVQAQQPMNQTPDFIRAMMRIVCLAFDMPLEIGNKDVSQVNFSGGRIGLIGFYNACRVKQDWIKSHAWNRIAYWALSIERQRQELGFADAFKNQFPANYGNFELRGRPYESNDRLSDAQADLLEISIGKTTPRQLVTAAGADYEVNMTEIQEHIQRSVSAGIPVVVSNFTRDATLPKTDAGGLAPEEFKVLADSYGVAVRAGSHTPQTDDEIFFRKAGGFPAMSEAVRKAWEKDGGIRRPITLQVDDPSKPLIQSAEDETK